MHKTCHGMMQGLLCRASLRLRAVLCLKEQTSSERSCRERDVGSNSFTHQADFLLGPGLAASQACTRSRSAVRLKGWLSWQRLQAAQ